MKKSKIISLLLVLAMLTASLMPLNVSAKDTISFVPETSNGKVYGIALGSITADVQLAYYNAVVEAYDKNGNKLAAAARIGTGYTVKLNGVSYAAVVMGDVNGDAVLDSLDYLAVKRSYLGTGYVGVLGLEAAGVKEGGRITAINYIMVKRAAFGTYNINRKYSCDPYNPGDNDSGWTPGWV